MHVISKLSHVSLNLQNRPPNNCSRDHMVQPASQVLCLYLLIHVPNVYQDAGGYHKRTSNKTNQQRIILKGAILLCMVNYLLY